MAGKARKTAKIKFKLTETYVKNLEKSDARYRVWDAGQDGMLIEVMPSGQKYFRVMYRHEGSLKTYTVGTWGKLTVAEARLIAKRRLGEVAGGTDVQATKHENRVARRKAKVATLRGFVDKKYAPWARSNRKSAENTLAILERNFGHLMDRDMAKITRWDLDKWRKSRCDAGIKPSTINRDTTTLKAVLNKAVEWGVIESNPLSRVPRVKEVNDQRVRYLTADEEKRLRVALRDRDAEKRAKRDNHSKWLVERGSQPLPPHNGLTFIDFLEPVVLLALNTGMRIGEIRQLTWDRVDLQRKQLKVAAATEKSAKTKFIPLNDDACSALNDWLQQTGGGGLVFQNDRTGAPFERNKQSWKNLMKRAKIEDFRIHDMRHHFASRLVMAGVDLNTVRELLGHSDIKTTLRYAHLAPEHKAAAVALLDQLRATKDEAENKEAAQA